MRNERILVLILINDKFTYSELLNRLKYINNLLLTLALLIFFRLGGNIK